MVKAVLADGRDRGVGAILLGAVAKCLAILSRHHTSPLCSQHQGPAAVRKHDRTFG
jgi:hypothetical protein